MKTAVPPTARPPGRPRLGSQPHTDRLHEIADELAELHVEYRAARLKLTDERTRLVRELLTAGWSRNDICMHLGMSKAAVDKMARGEI
jgi:hypothetical protein